MVKSRRNSKSKSKKNNKNTSRKNGGQKSKKQNKSRKIKGGLASFVLKNKDKVYDINYPINWTHLDNAHTYLYNSIYRTEVSNCLFRSNIQKMYTYFEKLENDDSDTTYHPSDTKRVFVDKMRKFAIKKIKSTLSTIFNYSLNFKLFEDAYNALVDQKLIKEERIINIHLHTKIVLVFAFVITFIIKYPLLILSDSIIPFAVKLIGTTTLINIAEGYCILTKNERCKIKDEIQSFLEKNGLDNIFDTEYNPEHVSIIYTFLRGLLKSSFVTLGNKVMFVYKDTDYLSKFKKYIDLDKLSNYIPNSEGTVSITPEAFGKEGDFVPDHKVKLSETCSSTN